MFFDVLSHFKDNRKKLIIILAIILLIVFFVKNANEKAKNQNKQSSSSNYTTTAFSENVITIVPEENSNGTSENYSIQINENKINSPQQAIQAFVIYCNNGQVNDAYNMLSKECKNISYNSIQDFYQNYYYKYFYNKYKTCNISNYSQEYSYKNMYRVEYKEEELTSGKQSGLNSEIDYITVIKEDNLYKLNLNGLIESTNLSINKSNDYMDYQILSREVYIDYIAFTVKIKNITKANMILSEMKDNSEIYFVDKLNKKANILNNDYSKEDMTITNENEKIVKFKFDKKYISTTSTNENSNKGKIVFSNMQLENITYYENIYDSTTGNTISKQKNTTYEPNVYIELEV